MACVNGEALSGKHLTHDRQERPIASSGLHELDEKRIVLGEAYTTVLVGSPSCS
jgi:hypothetical protein